MNSLNWLELKGFKSIKDLGRLEFRPLNIIIGANGAGKSNLVAFLGC
jgi:AAA15 family ATPase/GTPase